MPTSEMEDRALKTKCGNLVWEHTCPTTHMPIFQKKKTTIFWMEFMCPLQFSIAATLSLVRSWFDGPGILAINNFGCWDVHWL